MGQGGRRGRRRQAPPCRADDQRNRTSCRGQQRPGLVRGEPATGGGDPAPASSASPRELNRRATVDLGRIRIAYVAGDQQYLHARRHRGALRGPCGPPALRTEPEGTDFTMAAGAAVTRALPDRARPPTTIVCAAAQLTPTGDSVTPPPLS